MKDEGNDGMQPGEPPPTIEAMEMRPEEVLESMPAPIRALLRFWAGAIGPWQPLPQDEKFAELVDFVELEGPQHVESLHILFQRAVKADVALFSAAIRLASHVWDLALNAPGATGEAHQVSVDLDYLSTHLDGAWSDPANALGPSPSSTRDLLAMARNRQAQGECPGWVVTRLRAAVGDE